MAACIGRKELSVFVSKTLQTFETKLPTRRTCASWPGPQSPENLNRWDYMVDIVNVSSILER